MYCESAATLNGEVEFDSIIVGVLVTVDKGLIQVEEDSFEGWILFGQLDLLFGVWHFDGAAHSQDFNALIEVLPVKVHQVGGFVLAQTALQTSHVMHLRRINY